MGFLQEHGKVLKLQVVQTLFGYIPREQREQYAESFESACHKIMGQSWADSGLSMESAEGLSHYLRGVQSASGKPMRLNHRKLMLGVTRSVLSLESRFEACQDGTLSGALALPGLEMEAKELLSRYGLDGLSTEGKFLEAMKLAGTILSAGLNPWHKTKSPAKPGNDEPPFDSRKVDWSNVHKMAAYIDQAGDLAIKTAQEPVNGKISGEGIVKNLTWGHEFDEKDPVGFIKKKFATWQKFYQGHEQVVARFSAVIKADEKSTRAAINEAREDDRKMEKILDNAVEAIHKAENPSTWAAKVKCDFPGARTLTVEKRGEMSNGYDITDVVADKAFKDIKELRPLTTVEARALIEWLHGAVSDLKKYTTIYDKARWSDHSDGDAIWEQTENIYNDHYGILVYHQTCNADFLDGVDDISVILSHLSNGIMHWIDRSFPDL